MPPAPGTRKQAATKARKARALARLSSCWLPLAACSPSHCTPLNSSKLIIATRRGSLWSHGSSAWVYSPAVIATQATPRQWPSQSIQPTVKPARSPKARRAYTYQPPARGMAVESSATHSAPSRA